MKYESCHGYTEEASNLDTKLKIMANSRFALSNQNIVEKLKENAKHKNTLNTSHTWLNVWQTWATERRANPKPEKCEDEQLEEEE